MSGHTPGPWRLKLGKGVQYTYLVSDRNGQDIANWAHYPNATKAQTKANARLIAAAPDLLTVVQELEESAAYWSEYDVPLGIVDRLRAAIAKATGEGA